MGHTDRYPEVGLSEALVANAGGLRAMRKLSCPEVGISEVIALAHEGHLGSVPTEGISFSPCGAIQIKQGQEFLGMSINFEL